MRRSSDGTANATAYLGDGEGSLGEFGEFVNTWDFGDFDPKTTYLNLDYNNDGLDDILALNDSPDSTSLATVWLSDGLGNFTISGDQQMDTFSLGESTSANSYLIFDVDNDADVDLLEIWQDVDSTAKMTTWLNDSLGGFEESVTPRSFGSFSTENSHLVLDANNDGFKDLVIIWSGTDGTANATAYLGDGEGSLGEFGEFVDTWDFGDFDPKTTYLNLDYNNDGLDDILALNDSPDSTSLATVWLSDGLGSFTL